MNDGSCIRLRPERKDHVWSYDFLVEQTSDGRALKILTVVDEYTRECLAIHVARKMTAFEVIEQLADLFLRRGIPDHLRSDNGSEFTAHVIRGWLKRLGVKTLYIEPGSRWENGYIESFNTRYATFGFSDAANLDDGALWPTAFALKELNAAEEARIGALVKKAVR